jgi:uncharacterized membrane protein
MQLNLKSWIFALRTSFWPIPTAMTLLAIFAAFGIMEADLFVQDREIAFVSEMTMSLEGARLAVSTVAGSMITVASLVFSMTLISLTLVSQQLGPRILLHFMDDRTTQVMLGLFVATFIFALIVLLKLGDEALGGRVPSLSVLVTAGLAIAALGMMIRFIHHIATRIQADVLIAELGDDLREAAAEFFPSDSSAHEPADDSELQSLRECFDSEKTKQLALSRSGYLRRIDEENGCELAVENDLLLRLAARPGEFVLAGIPVLAVTRESGAAEISQELEEKLCSLVSVGQRRTPEASIEFEISALVEVALRALSPGINDPFTANACIDRLADGLRQLMQRKTQQPVTRDEQGKIRILHQLQPFSRYLSKSFDEIAEAGREKRRVLNNLISVHESLEVLAPGDNVRDQLHERLAVLKRYLKELPPMAMVPDDR